MDDAQYLKEYSLEEFIEARQQMTEKLQLLQRQKSDIDSQIQQIQLALNGTNAPQYSALRASGMNGYKDAMNGGGDEYPSR